MTKEIQNKFENRSDLYKNHKDLNEFHMDNLGLRTHKKEN